MWWSDRRNFLLAGLGAAGLAACGFTPAYGPGGSASRLQGTIQIEEPVDQDSYLLVRQLEHRLGRASNPRYGLSIALRVGQEGMAVSANNITSRFNVIGKATYVLRDLNDGKVLTSGTVNSFTGYSATGTPPATQTARRDAHERLMTILADQMTTRLIAASGQLPQ